jgi:hypothetical protein
MGFKKMPPGSSGHNVAGLEPLFMISLAVEFPPSRGSSRSTRAQPFRQCKRDDPLAVFDAGR